MAARKTKAELTRITEEAETEQQAAAAPPAPAKQQAPATTVRKPSTDIYTIGEPAFVEKNGLFNWTATITLGDKEVAKASWNATKKAATVTAIGKTATAASDLKKFEETAKRLLPGRDSITDLVIVLGVTSSPAISMVNKLLLTKDITGAAEIIRNTDVLAPKK